MKYVVLMLAMAGFVCGQSSNARLRFSPTDPSGSCSNGTAMVWNWNSGSLSGCVSGTWGVVATSGGGIATPVSIANGGTGQTTASAALNALAAGGTLTNNAAGQQFTFTSTANSPTVTITGGSASAGPQLQIVNSASKTYDIGTLGSGQAVGAATAGSFFIYDQGAATMRFSIDINGKTYIHGASINTGTASNTDLAGTLTLVGGTITRTFSKSYTSAPICVATDTTATNAVQTSVTTTVLTINGTSTDAVSYICMGRN